MIFKSSHRKNRVRNYSYADANEIQAIAVARPVLHDLGVKVPEVYFTGKVRIYLHAHQSLQDLLIVFSSQKLNERAVLIQERIPGVDLNVAWTYLSLTQKTSFKQQTREILRQLHNIKTPADHKRRSYIFSDSDPLYNRGIQELKKEILFLESNDDLDFSLMHNDCQPFNLIVDNDKVVELID